MTQFAPALRNRRMDVGLIISAGWLIVLICICIGAQWIAPYEPTKMNLLARLQPPVFFGGSWAHPLGTDNVGRDLLSRLLVATQLSVICALAATLIGGVIGSLLGFWAARSSVIDAIVSSAVDFQAALPFLIFAIALLAIFGNSLMLFVGILSIFGWERYARLTRSMARGALNDGYAYAARARGASWMRLALRHILPNIMGTIIVTMTLNVPQTILLEAAVSFLGIGVQPPYSSLGSLLGFSRDYLHSAWWLAVFPGTTIVATTLSINALGSAFADKLDPTR